MPRKQQKETLIPRIPPPPPVVIADRSSSSFLENMKQGFALGTGSSIAHKIVNSVSSLILSTNEIHPSPSDHITTTKSNEDKCKELKEKMMEVTGTYDVEWFNRHCIA